MTTIRPIAAIPFVSRRDSRASFETGQGSAPEEKVRIIDEPVRLSRVIPDVSVIAQLMATHLDAPQTRRLRRIDAEEGAAAYRATRDDIARGKREALPLPFWVA
jgi:hypothetical protein